jgi:tRNA (guanine37-N1)-methyltransferase
MKISILTLFPEMFSGPFEKSIVKRATDRNIVSVQFVNIRDFASDKYKSVDGHPYGGGAGMILRVDVIDRALQYVRTQNSELNDQTKTILLDAGGIQYTQKKAREFAKLEHLILICGHYEGVDARIRSLVDDEISIGDYVLTGGEIPAMVLTDSVIRLIPGVLKKGEATIRESFTDNSLEYPQYTEPREYNGASVPDVLVSGNHAAINSWQVNEALKRTHARVRRDPSSRP